MKDKYYRKFFKELLDRVHEEQDKVLLREAISCFLSANLRAAFIVVWISIAESIKGKFRKMSDKDKQAGCIVKTVKSLEKQKRSVDKYLIDKAETFGIIDSVQKVELENLFTMRSVYVHPYEKEPTQERVIDAMLTAVDNILSKPALLRHGYIVRLIDRLFKVEHYLDDTRKAVRDEAQIVASRLCPTVYRYTIVNLYKYSEKIILDKTKRLFSNRGIWFTAELIESIQETLKDDTWCSRELIELYPLSSSVILSTPSIWKTIPMQVKSMVFGILLNDNAFKFSGLTKLFVLKERNLLTERQHDQFMKAISTRGLLLLGKSHVPLDYYYQRIINDLKTYNWYVQNDAAKSLKMSGTKKIAEARASVQIELGRNILQSAQGKARSSSSLILSAARSENKWPYEFIRGLVYECFIDDDNKLRFKTEYMKEAILSSIRGCTNPNIELLQDLAILLAESDLKYELTDYAKYNDGKFSEVDNILDDIIARLDTSHLDYVEALEQLKVALSFVNQKLKEHNDD